MEKQNNFPDLIFWACTVIIFHSDIFDNIHNFTFIVLATPMPICKLGMSFGKDKSRKTLEKIWKKSGNLYLKSHRNPEKLV